jgi:hypothetical protein
VCRGGLQSLGWGAGRGRDGPASPPPPAQPPTCLSLSLSLVLSLALSVPLPTTRPPVHPPPVPPEPSSSPSPSPFPSPFPPPLHQQCEAKGCCFNPALSKTVPCFYPGGDAVPVTTVHVVQACHLDVGFADTSVNIINRWFDQFFPLAWELGQNLTALGGPWGLKFMAQSWLVSMYLDCPPNAGIHCPSPGAVANFTAAVARGYVSWHAWPFNGEFELIDPPLVEAGFALTHALDDALDVPRKGVVSQRDVPGMTRAVLPLLAANGVRGVSVGVNGASTPPKVPRAFVWRDEASNTSLPALWHPFGYGGIAFEDAVVIPGFPHALVMDWRGDNAGPPTSVAEVQSDWKSISGTFPGAAVVASTFDTFFSLLTPDVLARLPVVTSEIGDTWLHGAGSDPVKTAKLKTGAAARRACLESGACAAGDYAVANFTRFFLKNQEHTWGEDIKTYLHDTTHWSNADLQTALASNLSNFNAILASWHEQRAFGLDYALGALPTGHPLRAAVEAAWAELAPPAAPPNPAGDGWTAATPGKPYTVGRYTLAFDGATGAVSSLIDAGTGAVWASAAGDGSSLGLVEYQTYSVDDYAAWMSDYCAISPPPGW